MQLYILNGTKLHCYCVVTAGEVTVTMDTTTELSGTDEEDKREQSDYL